MWAAVEVWGTAHPTYVQWGVCILVGFLLAKCVF